MPQSTPMPSPVVIDRRRLRRVVRFFARTFLSVVLRDGILSMPILSVFRGEPEPRWRELARRYRLLAVELGGVLIKLGQYLSTRVDVLPLAVTDELAGLQDAVPGAGFESIRAQIEEDFGRPLAEVFPSFDREPLGAASLAQAHAARLPDGRDVVVKVLRPGIEVLVETDLRAIGRALRWLRSWSFIRKRIDLDWLIEEFTTTTRRELDLAAEGRHCERFAAGFADDPEILFPKIHWDASRARTLTQENVGGIRIGDLAALDAAGIDRSRVAHKLAQVYMRQVFEQHFVHADPHPGNLFVHPGSTTADGSRSFRLAFVDFGMVAEIPPRLREALRRLLIGMAGRDAAMVVKAVSEAGTLLPGADLVALEEAVESVFDRFWGLDLLKVSKIARRDAATLWKEFGQLVLDTPIQVQVDLMFAIRALEVLQGLTTALDPTMNPWDELVPYGKRLARESLLGSWPEILENLAEQLHAVTTLPAQARRTFRLAERGRLTVRTALAPDARRQVERLRSAVDRLATAILTAALVITGGSLLPTRPVAAAVFLGLAGVGVVWTVVSRFWR